MKSPPPFSLSLFQLFRSVTYYVRTTLSSLAFCYLGMSTMLPWNFLISVTSFWDYKFRNVTLDPSSVDPTPIPATYSDVVDPADPAAYPAPAATPTAMQVSFPSYLAIASNVPGAMTTLAHSLFGQRVRYIINMKKSIASYNN